MFLSFVISPNILEFMQRSYGLTNDLQKDIQN